MGLLNAYALLRRVGISFHPNGVPPKGVAPTLPRLQRLALHWDFLMRNRSRWIEDEDLRAKIAQRSRDHLLAIEVEEPFLMALARAGQVEVAHTADLGDAPGHASPRGGFDVVGALVGFRRELERNARRMPWESLLTMAARKYQNHERLVVYRRLLDLSSHGDTAPAEAPVKALFVESAPGRLLSVYDFDRKFRAVETYLAGVELDRCRHPSLVELRAHVATHKPAIIHVSGIDGYQGFQLLKKLAGDGAATPAKAEAGQDSTKPEEGVYFRDDLGGLKVEAPEAVAAALCAEGHRPLLVTFNLYNSSARLAAATVTMGAAAAIGVQDFIDDTVADIFFANLIFGVECHAGNANALARSVRSRRAGAPCLSRQGVGFRGDALDPRGSARRGGGGRAVPASSETEGGGPQGLGQGGRGAGRT